MTMNNTVLMAQFNAWANRHLYATVADLSEEAYRQDRDLYFGSIHRTLNHLLVVDRMWTGRIAGTDHGIHSLEQILFDDFPSLRRDRAEEDARFVAVVGGLDEDRLAADVIYDRIIGEGTQQTRCDHILLSLFNHQTHHRGQVHAALTQGGLEPPPLDVIFYLEEIGLS